jgi:uncharacterized ion transporter superfamily protein YfcC
MEQNKKKKWSFKMPDTYVIIFFVVLLAALLTYVLPLGRFEVNYKAYDVSDKLIAEVADGESASFTLDSKNYVIDASGDETLLLEEGVEEPLGEIDKGKARALEIKNGDKLSFKVVQEYGEFVSEGERKGISLFESGEM